MLIFTYLLAMILTAEQAFDCISTNLVLSKGRGHEGNGVMAWFMGRMGHWWWMAKLPFVAWLWWAAIKAGPGWARVTVPFSSGTFGFPVITAILVALVLVYAFVLRSNYKVAWRQ